MLGLTFLGTSDYKEATYQWQNQQFKTNLFPEAFVKIFHPGQLNVVMTQEAKEKHLKLLANKIGSHTKIYEVIIPKGQNESELWAMFDQIVDSIPKNSKLYIDVTHGFRSQPILVLSICIYLRMAKNVTIEKIVYGAWEARDEQKNISPVFDITPFLRLIDWTIAIDKFIESGQAWELSQMLNQAHRLPYILGQNQEELPRHLSTLARRLDDVSLALRAIRPKETMDQAFSMIKKLKDVSQEVKTWAKPFAVLLNQVENEYKPMALPASELFKTRGIQAQIEMMKWYVQKGYYMQAITLAREIVLTRACLLLEFDPIENREKMSKNLGKWAKFIKDNGTLDEDDKRIEKKIFAELWGQIIDCRNDIDHAGMRKAPRPSKKLIENIRRVCSRLEEVSKKWFA